MIFKKKKKEKINIGKVKKMIEQRLSILTDNSFVIDNNYLNHYQKQYRIYVYPYTKLIDNQRVLVILSYEYFLEDTFLMKFKVLNNDSDFGSDKGLPNVIISLQEKYNESIEKTMNTYEKVEIAFGVLKEFIEIL
jgi:hypothetical protein